MKQTQERPWCAALLWFICVWPAFVSVRLHITLCCCGFLEMDSTETASSILSASHRWLQALVRPADLLLRGSRGRRTQSFCKCPTAGRQHETGLWCVTVNKLIVEFSCCPSISPFADREVTRWRVPIRKRGGAVYLLISEAKNRFTHCVFGNHSPDRCSDSFLSTEEVLLLGSRSRYQSFKELIILSTEQQRITVCTVHKYVATFTTNNHTNEMTGKWQLQEITCVCVCVWFLSVSVLFKEQRLHRYNSSEAQTETWSQVSWAGAVKK